MAEKQRANIWGEAGARSRVKGRTRNVVLSLWKRETLTSNLSKA